MRTHFVFVFAALHLLTACAGSAPTPAAPAAPTAGLEGTLWTLQRFEGQPAAPRPVTLRFESGSASGRAPCNSISATYTRDADVLRFGPIASSKMYCADTAALEEAYLAALRKVDRARLDGAKLSLSGDGVQLEYVAAPPE